MIISDSLKYECVPVPCEAAQVTPHENNPSSCSVLREEAAFVKLNSCFGDGA